MDMTTTGERVRFRFDAANWRHLDHPSFLAHPFTIEQVAALDGVEATVLDASELVFESAERILIRLDEGTRAPVDVELVDGLDAEEAAGLFLCTPQDLVPAGQA